ncbi:MAG: MarR family winged helix-turn-helix transcriptional regulator [Coriobacteriia bacterium]
MNAPTSTFPNPTIHRGAEADRSADRAAIVGLLCAYAGEALRFTEEWAASQSMHTTDARAMAALGEAHRTGSAMTAGELSASIGLSSPATSALISRLESAGHIERARDPEDRRRVLVTPSISSVVSAVAYFQPMGAAVTAGLAGCDVHDRRVIAGFLERLVRSMRVMPPA